ncbi:MAG: hypothetical protein CMK07_15370, partial [Ponticaulis sp.]|nr:hypothetical protein [Ponticaulis sp.]
MEARVKLTESLVNKVSSIGFACAGPALAALSVSNPLIAGATAAMGLATAAGFIISKFNKHGIDSKAALDRIRKGIEDRFRDDPEYRFYEDQQAITRACELLDDELENLQLSPKELAGTGIDAQGFPVAATEIVLDRLVKASKSNPESKFDPEDDKQIAFTKAVLTATFETAVLDNQYWNEFNKHLQLAMAKGIGELKDGQARLPEATAKAVLDEWERRGLVSTLKTDTIMALARRLPDAGDLDQSVISLINALDEAEELVRQGHNPGNDIDAFAASVIRRISDRLEDGDLDGASEEAEAAFALWEAQEKERAEASKRNGMAILRAGIRADIAASRPEAVADKEIRLIELTTLADERFNAIRSKQYEYYVQGRDKGIRIDLEISIALARRCKQRAAGPDESGNALTDLGNALCTLGQRESGTARLEEAVIVYRSALEECTKDRVPLDWAMTQNNLGTAL